MVSCDVCVVGGGMAGASVAARLAPHLSVVLIDQEPLAGHHATGRSVAVYTDTLPGPQIQALTRASRAFFEAPPEGFAAQPLIHRRPVMHFATSDQLPLLDEIAGSLAAVGLSAQRLTGAEASAMAPILRPERLAGGILDAAAYDMDVDGLHQGWLRALRRAGGKVLLSSPLRVAERSQRRWRIVAGDSEISASVLVNAAGAWGDEVARLVGVAPLGLAPKRRTVSVLDAGDWPLEAWPMAVAADHSLYFKPDAGRLLVSAMEETPSPPYDAYADDLEVAQALDLFATTTSLPVRRPLAVWAGLRTFAGDGQPVSGYDEAVPGFFWLVGQGGAGIQTSPGLSAFAADAIRGLPLSRELALHGVEADALHPRRLGP